MNMEDQAIKETIRKDNFIHETKIVINLHLSSNMSNENMIYIPEIVVFKVFITF